MKNKMEWAPASSRCDCRDRDNKRKKIYASESEAKLTADDCFRKRGIQLHAYQCPEQMGWHLAKS